MEAVTAMQRAALGARDESEAEIIAERRALPHEAELREMFSRIVYQGTPSGQAKAQALAGLAGADAAETARASWDDWADPFFTTTASRARWGRSAAKICARLRTILRP